MRIIAFNSEAEGDNLRRLLWIATVKKLVGQGLIAKNKSGNLFHDVSALDDSEIAELSMCGELQGNFRNDNGSTIAYCELYKAEGEERWFIVAPEPDLIDLSDYEFVDMPEDQIITYTYGI